MLLALLFLIALILVLPQVDLPDYISSNGSLMRALVSHSPQSAARSILDSSSSPLIAPANPAIAPHLPALTSMLTPVRVIAPELRC